MRKAEVGAGGVSLLAPKLQDKFRSLPNPLPEVRHLSKALHLAPALTFQLLVTAGLDLAAEHVRAV